MSRSFLLPSLVLLVACGHDHTFNKVVDPIPPETLPISLRIDLALQDNQWGENTTRCQMQVAFEPIAEYSDPDETEAEAEARPMVNLPDEPGQCAFSDIPSPRPHGSTDDNWQLSGEVVGPDFIEMWAPDDSWTLDTTETDHGGLRYEWSECSRESYPFSSTLTMDVPASDDPDGVHPFTMEELVPVGPRLVLDHPAPQDGGQSSLDIQAPLYVEWHTEGGLPEMDGETQHPRTLVKVQTQDREREENVRWLVCWPEEGSSALELSPEALAPLFEDRTDPDVYSTHLDVHMEFLGKDRPTPWGSALTVRTNVSTGAGIRAELLEGEPPPL